MHIILSAPDPDYASAGRWLPPLSALRCNEFCHGIAFPLCLAATSALISNRPCCFQLLAYPWKFTLQTENSRAPRSAEISTTSSISNRRPPLRTRTMALAMPCRRYRGIRVKVPYNTDSHVVNRELWRNNTRRAANRPGLAVREIAARCLPTRARLFPKLGRTRGFLHRNRLESGISRESPER